MCLWSETSRQVARLDSNGALADIGSCCKDRPSIVTRQALFADFHRQSQQFMSIQVPRMHTETRPGEATPAEPESIVGAQVKFERITESGVSGGDKIYQYVQEPLRKWLANFDAVVVRFSQVKSVRRKRSLFACPSVCVIYTVCILVLFLCVSVSVCRGHTHPSLLAHARHTMPAPMRLL